MSARTLIAAALLAAGLLSVAARERAICVSGQAVHAEDYAAPAMGNGHIGFIPLRSGLGIDRMLCGTAFTDGSASEVSHIQPAVSTINLCMSGLKADGFQQPDIPAFSRRYRRHLSENSYRRRRYLPRPGHGRL